MIVRRGFFGRSIAWLGGMHGVVRRNVDSQRGLRRSDLRGFELWRCDLDCRSFGCDLVNRSRVIGWSRGERDIIPLGDQSFTRRSGLGILQLVHIPRLVGGDGAKGAVECLGFGSLDSDGLDSDGLVLDSLVLDSLVLNSLVLNSLVLDSLGRDDRRDDDGCLCEGRRHGGHAAAQPAMCGHRRGEHDADEDEERTGRQHPQPARPRGESRQERVGVRHGLRDLHRHTRLDPSGNRVVRGRHEQQRPLVLGHAIELRANQTLEQPLVAAPDVDKELLVRKQLRLGTLLVGLVHREILLQLVEFALRGNEYRGDDQRQAGDHEGPAWIEAEQCGTTRRSTWSFVRGEITRAIGHRVGVIDARTSGP